MFAQPIKLPPRTLPITRELRRALKLTKKHRFAPPERLQVHRAWDIYDEDDVKLGTAIHLQGKWQWK